MFFVASIRCKPFSSPSKKAEVESASASIELDDIIVTAKRSFSAGNPVLGSKIW